MSLNLVEMKNTVLKLVVFGCFPSGLLWNLSSHDMLKEQLGREAVKPIADTVLVPCSGITEGEDPKLDLLADPEVFLNATGCLRCVCVGYL